MGMGRSQAGKDDVMVSPVYGWGGLIHGCLTLGLVIGDLLIVN
jgi:hypothetical protein